MLVPEARARTRLRREDGRHRSPGAAVIDPQIVKMAESRPEEAREPGTIRGPARRRSWRGARSVARGSAPHGRPPAVGHLHFQPCGPVHVLSVDPGAYRMRPGV